MSAVPRLKIGLAGAGMVSQYHLRGWKTLEAQVELVAIADPDRARAAACAAQFGIRKTYGSVADLLAMETLDAVDLMTPPHLHGEHCMDAAARGVAILCQKPLAPQLHEARRVAANVAKDLEASRLERCKKAREDYNTTINSLRLYRTDKEGNRVYLNDAELSQRRIDAAKAVEAICGPQG